MGIFDDQVSLFTRYRGCIQFRDLVMAGTPNDPKMIEGWIRSKAGVSDEDEVRRFLIRTMQEQGRDVDESMSMEELEEAARALVQEKQTNVFKRTETGLHLESRQLKAGFREAVNILYAGDRWGPTKKSPKALAAERVFFKPDYAVYLCKPALDANGDPLPYQKREEEERVEVFQEPTSVELFVGHTTGPKGPQSNLSHIEAVRQARIYFEVMVSEDAIGWGQDARIDLGDWRRLWVQMQELGLGALRSQGFGRFDILHFEPYQHGDKLRERMRKAAEKEAEKQATGEARRGRPRRTAVAQAEAVVANAPAEPEPTEPAKTGASSEP